MKKILSIIMAACLLLGITAIAETGKTETLAGEVTEIMETGFMVLSDMWGEVRVNTDEKTVMEGQETLSLGDYVTVLFSGAMTASLPPQIYASKVVCIKLEGEVTSIFEDGKSIVIEAPKRGEIVVHLPEGEITLPNVGSYVVLYYSGIETMSLPPQLTAQKITSYGLLTGEVTQLDGDFLLLGEEEKAVRVNFLEGETIMGDEIKVGSLVQVLHNGKMTRSLPPQVFADRITLIESLEEVAK